jgi:hypothetical protein
MPKAEATCRRPGVLTPEAVIAYRMGIRLRVYAEGT